MACGCVFVDLSEEPGSLVSSIAATVEALKGNLCECRAVHQYFKSVLERSNKPSFFSFLNLSSDTRSEKQE